MIKNRTILKKTMTNLGEDPIMGTKSELFEIEAYQSKSGKSFGYIVTCVRTGKGWYEEFRGKYAQQDFEKKMDEMCVPMEIEWHISTPKISDTIEACSKAQALFIFYARYPEEDYWDVVIQRGEYVIEE